MVTGFNPTVCAAIPPYSEDASQWQCTTWIALARRNFRSRLINDRSKRPGFLARVTHFELWPKFSRTQAGGSSKLASHTSCPRSRSPLSSSTICFVRPPFSSVLTSIRMLIARLRGSLHQSGLFYAVIFLRWRMAIKVIIELSRLAVRIA